MGEWTATKEDIDQWLKELYERCDDAEFQEVYKAGWRDALTSMMIKMDIARRAHSGHGQRK